MKAKWKSRGLLHRLLKVWLNDDLDIAECYDIPAHEWSKILKIIKEKQKEFINKYHELNK